MDVTSVPESILEAGELFQRRVRMTLAMRQLWKERDEFLRHERGWAGGLGLGGEQELKQKMRGVDRFENPRSELSMEERRLRMVEDVYVRYPVPMNIS